LNAHNSVGHKSDTLALPAELRAHVVDLITIPQQGKIVKLVLKKVRRCCSA
jgi:hypothetical protein